MSSPTPTFEPYKWYDVTADDQNPACANYNNGKTFEVNPCYSNNGEVHIQCGLCGQDMRILTAVLLDPQPNVA